MFCIEPKHLGSFDLAVCGGGVAGVSAAVAAAREGARVILIESGGSLGGTLTEGLMPNIMDRDNKGGIVKELLGFLDAHGMTCARLGPKADAEGRRIPGQLIDVEGVKVFFDKIVRESGVKVLFHSRVAQVSMENGRIDALLLCTESGNYAVSASVYIDATGGGNVAALCGCGWDCGDAEGHPNPASLGVCVVGMPPDYNGADSEAEKTAYNDMLERYGIRTSAQQVGAVKLPSLKTWDFGCNFQYDVRPDDIEALSEAVRDARAEVFDVIGQHRHIPGYEGLYTVATGAHIGLREGRRIYGAYRLTDEDILSGRRFGDGICLVTGGVDVHKLKADDTTETSRGMRSQPYNIPFRCLLPLGVENLMLAGRCISGDFYPHASYRLMGNMMATGEAAGYAAAVCVREGVKPEAFDGTRVRAFMEARGYAV